MLSLTYQCWCHETAAPHQPQNNAIDVHIFLSFQLLQQDIQGNQGAHLGCSTWTVMKNKQGEYGWSFGCWGLGSVTWACWQWDLLPCLLTQGNPPELPMVGSGILPTVKDPGTGPLPIWHNLPDAGQEAYQDLRIGKFLSFPQGEQEPLQQSLLGLLLLAK